MTRYGDFRHLPTAALVRIAHFMSKNPVTGLNTINNLLRITGKSIPVDAPMLSKLTSLIVARELNMLFNRLRSDDVLIAQEDITTFTEEQIDRICFDRGINID